MNRNPTRAVRGPRIAVGVWNVERWDAWSKAIGFTIERCDPFKTGHGIANVNDGDFVINQEWLIGS